MTNDLVINMGERENVCIHRIDTIFYESNENEGREVMIKLRKASLTRAERGYLFNQEVQLPHIATYSDPETEDLALTIRLVVLDKLRLSHQCLNAGI